MDMPVPYAFDLRCRIVWLYLISDQTIAAIFRIFNVSERTVYLYISLFRQTGDVQPPEK